MILAVLALAGSAVLARQWEYAHLQNGVRQVTTAALTRSAGSVGPAWEYGSLVCDQLLLSQLASSGE